MEIGLCACCGIAAWGGSFVLLGQSRGALPVEQRMAANLRRVLGPLAQSDFAAELLNHETWSNACGEIARATSEFFGSPLTRCEASGLALAALGVSPVVGFAISQSPVGALGMVGGCLVGLLSWGASSQRKRKRELSDEMPGVFRTLAVALGSGQTLTQAISYVGSHEKGPAAHGFAMASLRLRCGASAEQTLELLADELDAPGMGLLVTALTISQRTGSPLKDLFQHSARLVEREKGLNRELEVKTAQVRLSARVVCLLPLLMVAILSLISPDFQEGVTTPLGMCCLGIALAMDVAAILIMKKLMKGVL